MAKELLAPDYIFEASWEVCNKVGGIYTVLSTRAKTLQEAFKDKVFFIGPDFWAGKENPLFSENENLCAAWREHALKKDGLKVRVGRWNIPGEPIVILVDFYPFFSKRNEIYGRMWEDFKVDSLHAYGDYDEASMFSYAAGKVVESFYRFNLTENDKVIHQSRQPSEPEIQGSLDRLRRYTVSRLRHRSEFGRILRAPVKGNLTNVALASDWASV